VQNKVITSSINTINTNLSNITNDVSDLQSGLQSAEDSIINAFEVNAPIEKSPSTHNYAVGDYLIWNEALRIVTQPITTGQALTNSNTRLTKTGKELSQINADLSESLFSKLGYKILEFETPNTTFSGREHTFTISNLPNNLTNAYILSAHLGGYVLPYYASATSYMVIDYFNGATKEIKVIYSDNWGQTTNKIVGLIAYK
jgi:hypothetical protein